MHGARISLMVVAIAVPALLFAVLVAAVWGPSLRNVILIITLWTWSGYARLVRADVLSLREREFVLAARAIGARDRRVLTRHVLPNLINVVVILMTMEVATVILFEAGLSFLNVGVEAGSSSWGIMISEGRNFMPIASWLIWIPGIAIVLISLTAMMMGAGSATRSIRAYAICARPVHTCSDTRVAPVKLDQGSASATESGRDDFRLPRTPRFPRVGGGLPAAIGRRSERVLACGDLCKFPPLGGDVTE